MEKNAQPIIINPKSKHQATIIWLHGLGADGNDFVSIIDQLELPQRSGIKFIFPHAPVRPVTLNGGMSMRAWFDITALDLEAPVDEAGIRKTELTIKQLIEQEIANGIPSHKIFLVGFSQGGAVALFCGLRYAQPLAGIIGLSTFLPLHERTHLEADPANKNIPIFLAHGTQDTVVPLQFGELTRNYLQQLGYPVQWRTYLMPHAVCPEEIQDMTAWLSNQLRTNE